MKVAISQIRPNPFQVRKHIDREAIAALAAEIKELGYWGGLRARKHKGAYELVFGHRRLEALKMLKVKEVDLEICDLSDDDMAMQALVENLQREGLSDLDKAAGLQALIERLNEDGKRQGRAKTARLMGLSERRIDNIVSLLDMPSSAKKLLESGGITGRTAIAARQLGGNAMIETAAKHKLPLHTLTKIGQELNEIPEEKIRAKVKQAVIAGKVRDPETVREHERKIRSTSSRAAGKGPTDLRLVVRQWTRTMTQWADQLEQVVPYIDYIEEDADLAAKFKVATRNLIEKLKRFL